MKRFATILTLCFALLGSLGADTLQDAYLKEYTFLKAQKEELTTRMQKEQKAHEADIAKATAEVSALQDRYVALSRELSSLERTIEKSGDALKESTSNREIVGSIVTQANMSLGDYGIVLGDENATDIQKIANAFESAITLNSRLSSLHKERGSFFLPDGSSVEGDIVKVGNIAAYGLSAKGSGALAPAGNGAYKLWNRSEADATAKALYEGTMPQNLNIFVYENLDKEVEYQKEKTFDDTLKAGGVIGYSILGLGAIGVLLIIIRAIFLINAGSNTARITQIVYEKLPQEGSEKALEAIANFHGSTARVIKATLRNIKKEREHIEDIVMESILNESSSLDRFGNIVLVIAAVAPLLGLLGTVTGMIATFDIITEFGTGDPKMLSGGISEALVTTMFGLIVAIPLLLLGNLLSGWAGNIKDSMEQSALHVVNLYEKHKTR